MKYSLRTSSITVVIFLVVVAVYVKGHYDGKVGGDSALPIGQANAESAPVEWSRTQPFPAHDVYYPGTEELATDEMRVIACGYWHAHAAVETSCRLFFS
jgi:hypothetical protein